MATINVRQHIFFVFASLFVVVGSGDGKKSGSRSWDKHPGSATLTPPPLTYHKNTGTIWKSLLRHL
jgi:hypothetical protein